jgi:hypothetical protein
MIATDNLVADWIGIRKTIKRQLDHPPGSVPSGLSDMVSVVALALLAVAIIAVVFPR